MRSFSSGETIQDEWDEPVKEMSDKEGREASTGTDLAVLHKEYSLQEPNKDG